MCLLGRRDGSQCDTPIQEEVRDHSSLQADIRRTAGTQAFILKCSSFLPDTVLLRLDLNIVLMSIPIIFLSS